MSEDRDQMNVDEVIAALTRLIRESSQNAQPIFEEPTPPLQPTPPTDPGLETNNTLEIRKIAAEQSRSQTILPALSESVKADLDSLFIDIPDLLKTLDDRPYLKKLIKEAKDIVHESNNTLDRSVELDMVLTGLTSTDSIVDSDRSIAILIGAAAGGVVIGQAIGALLK